MLCLILSIEREFMKMLKDRRSNIRWGRYSSVLVLPASIEKGRESTLAGNRLLLVDPRAEINEDDLLEFLETFVEPYFWPWYLKKRKDQRRRPQAWIRGSQNAPR